MCLDSATAVWTTLSEGGVLWARFDDEHVVYNRHSGETHYLNATAAAVLELVERGPTTLAALVAEIRGLFDMEDTQETELCEHIRHVIQEFDRVGLICPLPP